MDMVKFYENVVADEKLEGEGIFFGEDPADDYVVIKNLGHQSKTAYKIDAQAIIDNKWDVLRAILHDERRAIIMTHMSRIVGYYSKIKDWNPSKLGELRDRQAGRYSWDNSGT
jgi:hypothetical protein